MRLVVISDTHGMYDQLSLPEGDVLIHCGDILPRGSLSDLEEFNDWLVKQPYKHKIIIAGNHDRCFQNHKEKALKLIPSAIYLEDSYTIIEGIKFHGSPWTPIFYNWYFMLDQNERAQKWQLIDKDTDVLITHGPPFSILDEVLEGDHVGCPELLKRVKEVSPRYHFFGHIHEGYGKAQLGDTTFINASINTEKYMPSNSPIIVDL